MITHDVDADGAPYQNRFVLWVPRDMRKKWNDYTPNEKMMAKIKTLPEMKWLKKTKVDYKIWFEDWDIGGPNPVILIDDRGHAALFKLTFHEM